MRMHTPAPQRVTVYTGGLSLSSVLGVVFVVLKLTGHVTWPWIWVLMPFLLPWLVFLAIALVVFL